MRKIESREKSERKQKRNGILIGVLLIGLMVSSTVGFIFAFRGGGISSGGGNDVEPDFVYNGIDFFRVTGGVQFQTSEGVFEASLDPSVTENTELGFDVSVNDFVNKPLYYVFDEPNAALGDLERVFQSISLRRTRACLEGVECTDEEAVRKTCEDDVIVIRASEEIKTYKENNCIFIEGTEGQQLLLADRLIYEVLGIQ